MRKWFPWLLVVSASVCSLAQKDDPGKIMRPVDKSAHAKGTIDVIATAPSGKLALDGQPIQVAQPFPNVFHGSVKLTPGEHTIALTWEGGRKEVRIFGGPGAPKDFALFVEHPPMAGVQCTQCHELSSRGRFRFKGGCFDCHKQDGFAKIHTHPPAVLEECGMCHNAHGSTVKSHLIHSKENSCKICHN